MKKFNNEGRGGFGANRPPRDRSNFRGGSFGSNNRGAGRFGGEKTMHQAVCAECSKVCEVPFKPSGEKPVYCSSCFSLRSDDRSGARNDSRQSFSRPAHREESSFKTNNNLEEKITEINAKLDKILDLFLVKQEKKLAVKEPAKKEVKKVDKKEVKPVVKKVTKKLSSNKKVKK